MWNGAMIAEVYPRTLESAMPDRLVFDVFSRSVRRRVGVRVGGYCCSLR